MKRLGTIPIDPFARDRVVSTKLNPDFHRAVRELAFRKDATISAIVRDALAKYVAQESARKV